MTNSSIKSRFIWKDSRATSAMMDVLIDEQEMPEPVRLRVICVVPDELEIGSANDV